MSTHEIRYKGRLIGHMSEAAARTHVRARLTDAAEADAFDADDWTVSGRKPFELHSRGNLVDTFATESDAHDAMAAAVKAAEASGAFRKGTDVEAFFTVIETDARTLAPPPPPPPEPTIRDRRPTQRHHGR